MRRLFHKSQRGSALLPFVVVIPFLILIVTYFMNLSVSSFKVARKDQSYTHAQFTTDAGIDLALQEINEDVSWAGTGSEVELLNDGQVRTTYQVTVTTNNAQSKTLTSVGRTYRPANAATPESSVTIKVDLRAITSGGTYSLVTGVGGLYMQNSAKIVGGDVLVNGELFMQNSAQIGLTTTPLNVNVAHYNCPVAGGATYPRLCASGENGQPVTIQNTARIYGNVKANNQTNGAGMSNPGLTAGSGVAPGVLPAHNRAAQIDAHNSSGNPPLTSSAGSCSGSQNKTWAANTKITGDVSLSNTCRITVEGDVWITGRLTVQNSARIVVSDTLADTMPTIMVDGSAGIVMQNSGQVQSNASSTGAQLITYWSRASCSPDCADVTGADLYASRNDRTIYLQNSASASASIVYARWTQAELGNGGNIGAVVGQTVRLSNSATITFETSTEGGGGTTTWIIDGYRRSF